MFLKCFWRAWTVGSWINIWGKHRWCVGWSSLDLSQPMSFPLHVFWVFANCSTGYHVLIIARPHKLGKNTINHTYLGNGLRYSWNPTEGPMISWQPIKRGYIMELGKVSHRKRSIFQIPISSPLTLQICSKSNLRHFWPDLKVDSPGRFRFDRQLRLQLRKWFLSTTLGRIWWECGKASTWRPKNKLVFCW